MYDNTGLTGSAEIEECAGNPIYSNGKQVGVTRISSIGTYFHIAVAEDEEKTHWRAVFSEAGHSCLLVKPVCNWKIVCKKVQLLPTGGGCTFCLNHLPEKEQVYFKKKKIMPNEESNDKMY